MVQHDKRPVIGVVVPIYNPPLGWQYNTTEHMLLLKQLAPKYQFKFLLINDGSRDDIITEFKQMCTKTKLKCSHHSLNSNQGKGMALKFGVSHLKADYYICVDWDFPFGVNTIIKIIDDLVSGSNLVIIDRGSAYINYLPPRRAMFTRIWRFLINNYFKLNVADTQGGLKGFDKKGARSFTECELNGFLQDTEFVLKARNEELKISSVISQLRPGVKLTKFPTKVYIKELQNLWRLIKLSRTLRKKWITINADDYGMSIDVNRAIQTGIHAGVITSVSVMVNTDASTEAIQFLKSHPQVKVGLHANFTDAARPRSGLFLGRVKTIINLLTKKKVRQAAFKELERQYQILNQSGLVVSHLDSHEHIHLLFPVYEYFIKFAQSKKISLVRHCHLSINSIRLILNSVQNSFKGLSIVIMYLINYLANIKYFITYTHPGYIWDISWLKECNKPNLSRSFANLPYGRTEIICHAATLPFRMDYSISNLIKKHKICLSV